MDVLLRILPTVALVAYSQIVVKWRVETVHEAASETSAGFYRYIAYLLDPFILSAYLAALVGSFFWLYTVSKLPLAQAFPIYQGLIFVAVVAGSAGLLHEPLTTPKLVGAGLILAGVAIGVQA